jgi:transcription termination factor Rho
LLTADDELQRMWILRKLLHPMDEVAAIEFLVDKLKTTKTNDEFFLSMKQASRRFTQKAGKPGFRDLLFGYGGPNGATPAPRPTRPTRGPACSIATCATSSVAWNSAENSSASRFPSPLSWK